MLICVNVMCIIVNVFRVNVELIILMFFIIMIIVYYQSIFRMTNGMYPELITRPDIKIFLPPIGGLTIYIWGDPDTIPDEDIELTCRVHDECNGSDVSLIMQMF